jgi:sugar transferase (PEP-CTERM system associated)
LALDLGEYEVFRFFRHYLSSSAISLFLIETSVVIFILFYSFNYYLAPELTTGSIVSNVFLLIALPASIISVVMYATGLYDRWHLGDFRRIANRLAACFLICLPILILLFKINSLEIAAAERLKISFYMALTSSLFIGVLLARIAYLTVAKVTTSPNRVLVVGVGKLAADIERLMAQHKSRDTEIVGYVNFNNETTEVSHPKIIAKDGSLLSVARELGARELVIALDDRRGAPLQPFLDARMEGIRVTSYLNFWERETRRVNLRALDPSWLIYSDGFRIGTVTNAFLKRLIDISASLVLTLFMLPMILIVAVVIRLDSKGPLFYLQERVGQNGRNFKVRKFRTMRTDAEAGGVPQWAAIRDPRITRVGSFLRMTRIDEIPQVINVLRGDMSFVGPRPERPFFVESLGRDIPFYGERHRVRPGITGWAQINYPYGASIEDAKAKLSYDLYYIKNYSVLFDILIILATAQAILFNKGAR